MGKRAVLILAGGQARRFQVKPESWEDKALALLFGKPLIVNIIQRISGVADEIIICVNDEIRKARFLEVLREHSINDVRISIDEENPKVAGPLVAIATGLRTASADYCVTLPCDVPLVQPTVVDYLFNSLQGFGVAVPIWPDGGLESLMVAYERTSTERIAHVLLELGRQRPDDLIRGASKALFVSTVGELKKQDPDFASFININLREDLAILPKRVVKDGPIKENLNMNMGSPTEAEVRQLETATRHNDKGEFEKAVSKISCASTRLETEGLNFWAGASFKNEGEILLNLSRETENTELKRTYHVRSEEAFVKAAQNYGVEADKYEKNSIAFLARHARTDQSLCQKHSQTNALE